MKKIPKKIIDKKILCFRQKKFQTPQKSVGKDRFLFLGEKSLIPNFFKKKMLKNILTIYKFFFIKKFL